MKYLGIDYGTKYVGTAIGDDETAFALPLQSFTYTDDKKLFADLIALIQSEDIESIVVGIPRMGSVSEDIVARIENFVKKLHEESGLPVTTADESFTSLEAQKRLSGRKGKNDDHAVAAMLILQGYFDYMSFPPLGDTRDKLRRESSK
ncbi:Holliday junction resolvase RuvX [Candidatus Uhrbacteria bacterium]|nr:Holliday junction resolvase RuvX [Candidatus Uhrbacteria bacterium]